MNKAIFLDRDGTINVEKNYLYRVQDFEFLPNVLESLRTVQDAGYRLIIITNQSGIARGYYTEEDYKALTKWMIEYLGDAGINIDAVYYCPHHPNAVIPEYRLDCCCRKPKLGLFYKAIADFGLDINRCFTIGDKIRDCSICESTGCHGFLISTNENDDTINRVKNGKVKNVQYAKDLTAAIDQILHWAE